MPRPVDRAHFEEIVGILEARARHLLQREARLGATSRFTGKARIGDDELRDRILRLKSLVASLTDDSIDYCTKNRDLIAYEEFWHLLAKLEAPLNFHRLAEQTPCETKARLEHLWQTLYEIALQLEGGLRNAGTLTDPALIQITPEELEALGEVMLEDPQVLNGLPAVDPELVNAIAQLLRLYDTTRRCISETRAVLAGRFDPSTGRGAPRQNRGKRHAAELLGMAEGLGLDASRDHDNHCESGIDAVVAARRRCEDLSDPIARIILAEIPETFDAFARQLPRDRCKDRILIGNRRLGRVLGKRLLHQT